MRSARSVGMEKSKGKPSKCAITIGAKPRAEDAKDANGEGER